MSSVTTAMECDACGARAETPQDPSAAGYTGRPEGWASLQVQRWDAMHPTPNEARGDFCPECLMLGPLELIGKQATRRNALEAARERPSTTPPAPPA